MARFALYLQLWHGVRGDATCSDEVHAHVQKRFEVDDLEGVGAMMVDSVGKVSSLDGEATEDSLMVQSPQMFAEGVENLDSGNWRLFVPPEVVDHNASKVWEFFDESDPGERCSQTSKERWAIASLNASVVEIQSESPKFEVQYCEKGPCKRPQGTRELDIDDFVFENSKSVCLKYKVKPDVCASLCARIAECGAFGTFPNSSLSRCCLNNVLDDDGDEAWYQSANKQTWQCFRKKDRDEGWDCLDDPDSEECNAQDTMNYRMEEGNCRTFAKNRQGDWKQRAGPMPSGMLNCSHEISRHACAVGCWNSPDYCDAYDFLYEYDTDKEQNCTTIDSIQLCEWPEMKDEQPAQSACCWFKTPDGEKMGGVRQTYPQLFKRKCYIAQRPADP